MKYGAVNRYKIPTSAILCLAALACCTAPPDTTVLDQPLLTKNEETRFALSPSSGEIKLRDAVAIAKVLRKYRDLDAAEKALVKLAVRRHFDGLVALEVRKLEQANTAQRERIRGIADPVARQQADAALSAKLLAEASRLVAARLGGLLAVPMKTATNQSVVAFARVVSDDIRVADAAYELDVPTNKIGPQTKIAAADAPQDKGLQSIGRGERSAQAITTSSISIK